MNHTKGLRRALALLIGLMLAACAGIPALAEEETIYENEMTQSEKEEPGESSAQKREEPDITPEMPEESEVLKPLPDQEEEPLKHTYGANWTGEAFSGQTVNYKDELIIGVGTSIHINPERDIALTLDGESAKTVQNSDVRYQSSNDRYVTVDERGKLYAERKGAAQLQVTVELPDGNQKQLKKSVKIVDEPDIRFAPDYALLESGGKLDLGQYAKVPLLKAFPNVNAHVRYEIAPVNSAGGATVLLDENTGKLSAFFDEPGDVYAITARTYAGKTAHFTLYLGGRADELDILVPNGAVGPDGQLRIRSGETLELRATAFSAGTQAGRQDVAWKIETGSDFATILDSGLLRVFKEVSQESLIRVSATTQDGSEIQASLEIIAVP